MRSERTVPGTAANRGRSSGLWGAVMVAAALALGGAGEAPAQVRGGVLTASITTEPRSLDPLLGNARSIDQKVLAQIFDSLARWSEEGTVVPHLATAWSFSADGLELTLEIAPGVSFHDGTPVDAEAVAYNLRRVTAPEVNSPYATEFATVQSVEVTGPLGVRLKLSAPSASILAALTGPAGYIASPAAIEARGEDFGINPVGSGPFRMASRQSGANIVLERNPAYWRQGADGQPLPYLDGVTFRFITETAVKMIELEAGSVHLVDDLQPGDHDRVKANPALTLIDAGGISQWMVFNITRAPFDDLRVRQAIYLGLDRPAMAQIIAGAYGYTPPFGVHRSESVFDDSIDPYAYDPARARALLAEAGFGPANPLAFELSLIQREPDSSTSQIIQAQLAEIGVTAKLSVLERQAYVDHWRSGQHEVGLARVDIPRGDPDAFFSDFFGRKAPPRGGAGNPEVFDMVDAARSELDPARRRQLYIDIQKKVLDEALFVWLYIRESKFASTARLRNLPGNLAKAWYLDAAWLEG